MTVFTDAGDLMCHWRTTSSGYDSLNTRLTDFSGQGNHLPKLAGTVAYATRDTFQGMTLHGDCYFGAAPIWLPACHTIVSVAHPNLNAGEQHDWLWWTRHTYPGTDDPEWAAPSDAFEDNAGTAVTMNAFNGTAKYGDNTNHTRADHAYTNNAWNVFVGVMQPVGAFMKLDVDSAASPDVQVGYTHYELPYYNDDFRLGFRTATLTTASSEHFTHAQTLVYAGDLFTENPTGLAALVAALDTNPIL